MAALVYTAAAVPEGDLAPARVLAELYGDEEREWQEHQKQKESEKVFRPLDRQQLNQSLMILNNTPVKTKYVYPLEKNECTPVAQCEIVFNLARPDLLFRLVDPNERFQSFAILKGLSAINWELWNYRHDKQYQNPLSIIDVVKPLGICYMRHKLKRMHPLLATEQFRNFEAADIASTSTVRVINVWLNAEHCGKRSWEQSTTLPKDGNGLMCWLLLEKVSDEPKKKPKEDVISAPVGGDKKDQKSAPNAGSGGVSNPSANPVMPPPTASAPAQTPPTMDEKGKEPSFYYRLRPVTTRHRYDRWPGTPDYIFRIGVIRNVSDSSISLQNQPELLNRFLYPRTPFWTDYTRDLSFADITLYL